MIVAVIIIAVVLVVAVLACCKVSGDCSREEERSCRKGNHIYADIALQCCYDDKKMVYRYRNSCCKCGKVNEWEVPVKNILLGRKETIEAWNRRAEDGK